MTNGSTNFRRAIAGELSILDVVGVHAGGDIPSGAGLTLAYGLEIEPQSTPRWVVWSGKHTRFRFAEERCRADDDLTVLVL